VSDRPADRRVPPLARSPAQQPAMSNEEREAVRQVGADDARRSRVEPGFPARIEDPAAVAMLVAILRDMPARRPPSESTSDEKEPGSMNSRSGGDGPRDPSPPLLRASA
jgi:hypothetical protein